MVASMNRYSTYVFGINSASNAGTKIVLVSGCASHYYNFPVCITHAINSKYYVPTLLLAQILYSNPYGYNNSFVLLSMCYIAKIGSAVVGNLVGNIAYVMIVASN